MRRAGRAEDKRPVFSLERLLSRSDALTYHRAAAIQPRAPAHGPAPGGVFILAEGRNLMTRLRPVLAALLICATLSTGAMAQGTPTGLEPEGRWSGIARGQALTPPMGWSSWNAFGMRISEDKILGVSTALTDTGLARLGYRYVNIDDGWWLKRRQPDGRLQVRTELFPSAAVGGAETTSFRPLVDKLHAMGLKAGIYSDMGRNSCSQTFDRTAPNLPEGTVAEREVGLYGHVDQDIRLFFKDWGFDYIKVDGCGIDDSGAAARAAQTGRFAPFTPLVYRDAVNRSDLAATKALYGSVADALARENPDNDYVYSLCLWGAGNVRAWGKEIANLSRTSDDIKPVWGRMLHVFDSAATRPLYAHPGTWNDPDMLYVGQGDFDQNHLVEARSHFSLWAMINAPLLIGLDLRTAPKSILDIFGNEDLIRVNQDPGGHQATLAYTSDDVEIFVKTLEGTNHKAVALFNRGGLATPVTLTAAHLKMRPDAPIVLRDLWSKETLAPFTREKVFQLAPRQTLVFEVEEGARALAGGWYLSEIPGRINVAKDGVVRPEADPTIYRAINPYGDSTRSSGSRPTYAGWGGAAADENVYGEALSVNGRKFASGIGILANSRMQVRADKKFSQFTTEVGVDDNTLNPSASVVFEAYGDGKLLARSKPMKAGDAAVALKANIKGVAVVELVVRQAAQTASPVATVWGGAAVMD
ncbi:MAG: alpha-galactosidase [Caulobacteraceae bacterium]|nr:alpha-galactosidase [Caulobacteraceae bacterium]